MFNLFHTKTLRGDIYGGLTAAIVSLPLALTFGIASGAGPEAGLYGALLTGLFAALFGGTPTLITEPTGPMTVIMATVISTLIAADPENGLAQAFGIVILAGVFQIIFGALKLGRYITLMPYSVVSGFMSGIGIILMLLQLAPLLGQATPAGGSLGTIIALPEILTNANVSEIVLSAITLAILLLTPTAWRRKLPPQLIGLIAVSLLSVLLFNSDEIRRIGAIEFSFPVPRMPEFDLAHWSTMLFYAAVLGMLGCIDSMLTSVIADNMTNTEHKSNQELIGQGFGNIASGLVGGLPGAGATMGTVVNIQAGATSAWSGVTRVIVLASALLLATHWLQFIPLAVLAAIAFKVGIDILDWSFIKRAHRVSWQSTMVMYTVMLLTVMIDLMVAVGVGVFVANILIIEKLSASQSVNIKAISDTDDTLPLSKQQRKLLNQAEGKLLYFYLSGTMIFGVSRALARERNAIQDSQTLLIDLSDVSMMDDTIMLSVENMVRSVLDRDQRAIVVCTNSTWERLTRLGEYEDEQRLHHFAERGDALEFALKQLNLNG